MVLLWHIIVSKPRTNDCAEVRETLTLFENSRSIHDTIIARETHLLHCRMNWKCSSDERMVTFVLEKLLRKIAVLRSPRGALYASFLLTAPVSTPCFSLTEYHGSLCSAPCYPPASSSLCSLASCSRHLNYAGRAFIFNLFLEITICWELARLRVGSGCVGLRKRGAVTRKKK